MLQPRIKNPNAKYRSPCSDGNAFYRSAQSLYRLHAKPCILIPVWGKAYMNGKQNDFGDNRLTPLQVADNLDHWTDEVDRALPKLKSEFGENIELRDLLWGIESMAFLGRYYADKPRCATKYWACRESEFDDRYNELHQESIAHIKEAASAWEANAAVLDEHHKLQLLARTHYLDWNSTLSNEEGTGRKGQAPGSEAGNSEHHQQELWQSKKQ